MLMPGLLTCYPIQKEVFKQTVMLEDFHLEYLSVLGYFCH